MRCTVRGHLQIRGFWPAVGRFFAALAGATGATGAGAGRGRGTERFPWKRKRNPQPATTDYRPSRHAMNNAEAKTKGACEGRAHRLPRSSNPPQEMYEHKHTHPHGGTSCVVLKHGHTKHQARHENNRAPTQKRTDAPDSANKIRAEGHVPT